MLGWRWVIWGLREGGRGHSFGHSRNRPSPTRSRDGTLAGERRNGARAPMAVCLDAGSPPVGYDQPGENASTAPITKAALR